MGCDAALFRIPAGTFDTLRRARGFKAVSQLLWDGDGELPPPSNDIAKTRVEIHRMWLDLPLLFEAIDGAVTPPGATAYQLARLKPIRGLRNLYGFTLSPSDVMVLASSWAQAAQRANVGFRPWTGPPQRLDLARGKPTYASYDVIPSEQVAQVVSQLVERTVTTPLEAAEYPMDWLVEATVDLVRVFSEGAMADEGMLVIASP